MALDRRDQLLQQLIGRGELRQGDLEAVEVVMIMLGFEIVMRRAAVEVVFGACAMADANIVDAQIFTTSDGRAIDTIAISRAFERDEDELRRAEKVARTIEQLLEGRRRVADVGRKDTARARAQTFHVAPEVVIDNTLSNRFTVVEVSGLDRTGLLHQLTRAIADLNLTIGSAHIGTYGEKAVDVFYVTDLTGHKIESKPRQKTIRDALRKVFEPLRPQGEAPMAKVVNG